MEIDYTKQLLISTTDKEKELIKYLYHHQEALCNKIFIEYFGQDQLENFSKDYLLQGYFEI